MTKDQNKQISELREMLSNISEKLNAIESRADAPLKANPNIELLDRILEKYPLTAGEKDLEDYSIWLYNLALAERIVKWYNNGWMPDFDNSNEYKWALWYEKKSSSFSFHHVSAWGLHADIPLRLLFKSKEIALEAEKMFPKVFKTAITG